MAEALYHPTLGYYNRVGNQRWGREGDYRTSPERSELFAATFAHYFVSLYEKLGRPPELRLVEIGAGNGLFAAKVLETLKKDFADLFKVTRYVVIEASQDSRSIAAEELEAFNRQVEFRTLDDLAPLDPGIVFTNELLDAFPVHRLTIHEGHLQELFVCLDTEGNFNWVADEPSQEVREICGEHLPPLAEDQIVELNSGIHDWFKSIAAKLRSGYLVTVDYGARASELYSADLRPRGSLRAFRRHEFVDNILSAPGEYDITSTVDWTYVESEGKQYGFEVDQFMQLDMFLMQVGILDELEARLTNASTEAERSALTTSAREMILPGGMAANFQVMVQKR